MVALGRFPQTNFLGHLGAKDWEVVEQAMMKVKIEHKRDSLLFELSDGERQRTLIAKALAQDTPIIFLDEPTSFLDMRNKIEIMQLLHSLAMAGKTILLSTHDIDIALQTSDRVWLMTDKFITPGVPEDLILNGMIAKTFHSDAFIFDLETASFKVKNQGVTAVNLSGPDSVQKNYTEKALQRTGYTLTTDAETQVSVEPVVQDGVENRYMALWKVTSGRSKHECHSIEDMLFSLKKLINR